MPRNIPSLFEDFFKPWDWIDSRREVVATLPAVNITENTEGYQLSLAAPGLKKEDFNIDVEGNTLTISSEKEEKKEEKDERMTRKEYSYASFVRSFNLPEDVKLEAIDATYENGVLRIALPKKEEAKKLAAAKKVAVH